MIKAKYTVVLKALMDNPEARAALDDALSRYPLYEKKSPEKFIPSYIPTRQQLNNKILNHYKYREIGFETVGRFLDELEIAMEEIMPEYNLLFLTADQDFNIIWNVDYEKNMERTHRTTDNTETDTTNTGTTSTTNEAETNTTNTGTASKSGSTKADTDTTSTIEKTDKTVKTGTPQGYVSIPASAIDTVTRADEVNWNKEGTTTTEGSETNTTTTETDTTSDTGKTTTTGSGSTNTNDTGTATTTGTTEGTATEKEITKGNFGVVSAQDLILKYRETIINIEKMIIDNDRIQDLFMLIY